MSASGPGESKGLPGYLPEPPSAGSSSIPLPPPAPPDATSTITGPWWIAVFPLVFGIVGFTVFNLFGIVAIIIGIPVFRSTGVLGRIMSAVGVVLGAAGLIWSIVDFVRTHELLTLIF